MALWGITDGAEKKPNWLSQTDKNNTVAKAHGWELQKTVGSRTLTETLVAVGSSTNLITALAEATINAVYFTAATYDQADSGSVTVVYNENVSVTNGATLVVTGSTTGAVTATAAAHTAKNKIVFAFTVPSATETLSIAAQTITATVVDAGTAVVSDKVVAAGDIHDAGGAGTGGTATIAVA